MRGRWILAATLVAYLATRLLQLGLLPMVSDEGTYITWGVRALHARSLEDWLVSLEDGKQPLLAWLMPPFLAMVPDRLVAGRLVSVIAGLANLLLLVYLGRRLYGRAAGWLAAALYVAAPIALIHDRMALYDSLVATTSLLVLLTTLAWAERPDSGRTIALGLSVGAALLTKLSALFFVALVPLVILLWRPAALRRWWVLAQAFFLGAAIYSVLYASPIVDNIQEGNFLRYSLTIAEVLQFPLDIWVQNVVFIGEAALVYLGWPLTVIAIAALAYGAAGGRWVTPADRVVALWTLVPIVAFVLTAKIIYSRYVVFCFIIALLPAARALAALAGRHGANHSGQVETKDERRTTKVHLNNAGPIKESFVLRSSFFVLCLRPAAAGLAAAVAVAPGLLFDAALLRDPRVAPWMNDKRYITDRFQYVESNYAGFGLPEIVDYLRAQARNEPIVVLSRNTTGMPRDGVTAYLLEWPNVQVGFVPENESIEARLVRQPDRVYQLAARGADVYYVLTDAPNGEQERRFRTLNPGVSLLMEIPKPGNHSRFQLYKTRWLADSDDTWIEPPAKLGSQILLRGFRLSSASVRAGGSVRLVLYWEALSRPSRSYTVFNHVAQADGTIRGQKDGQPVNGQHPTSRWRPGETVGDVYDLHVKPDTPPGAYDLITGMYDLLTMQRVPVMREGEPVSDRVLLGQITVQ